MSIFQQKTKSIANYALKQIAPLLNVNQLQELHKSKTYFVKRVLGVHTSAQNTLCLHIIGWPTLIEDLRHEYNFSSDELHKNAIRKEKN